MVPEKEDSALFITTSFIRTQNQTRTTCYETNAKTKCPCDHLEATENGIAVGRTECNSSDQCEIYGWCPLEQEDQLRLLQGANETTILVRNYIDFSRFDLQHDTFYNNQAIKGKNLFDLSHFLESAGTSLDKKTLAAGAIIGVVIRWRCNADVSASKCLPEFEFERLDNHDSNLSTGYNFRYARYHREDQSAPLLRDLYKVSGIRLAFLTNGIATKFNLVKLIVSLGTGLGILFFAGFLSDIISMWMLPLSPYFRNKKYMNVDAEKVQERRMKWNQFLDPELLNKAHF